MNFHFYFNDASESLIEHYTVAIMEHFNKIGWNTTDTANPTHQKIEFYSLLENWQNWRAFNQMNFETRNTAPRIGIDKNIK